MNHKGKNILGLVVLAAWAVAVLPSAPAQVINVPNLVVIGRAGEASGNSARPMPLVNVDDEMGGYLKDAQEMIAKKDYAAAIDILQALLDRAEQCFITTSDPRRYVSLAARATKVIGRMPPEGLRLYRGRYDPRARRLFRQASENRDEPALRDIVRRFFHTSSGDDALNLLGTFYFDRGEYSQAARCWRDIAEGHSKTEIDPPTLLAKIAVAYHLAGEDLPAGEMLNLLTEGYAEAEVMLAGEKQNAVGFVKKMLAMPPPEYAATAVELESWPSMAGAPDSVAIMGPCRPVLSPRWTRPAGSVQENPNLRALISGFPQTNVRSGRSVPNQPQTAVVLREGRVSLLTQYGNRTGQPTVLPALIHPVVVGTTVLHRGAECIVAHDLVTGEKLWASFNFPLYRGLPVQVTGMSPSGSYGLVVADTGMSTLSVGEGKVFAVGRFLPSSAGYYLGRVRFVGRQPPRFADDSVLAAFSVAGEGRLMWQVGDGAGNADVLHSSKFLTAPTYWGGRLYVMAEYMQAYHLICLNAENGHLVWHAMVGQMPPPPRSSSYPRYRSRGSPPAGADGRVFAVTNAGVLGAFDAETGRAVWAYQYPVSTGAAYSSVGSRSIPRGQVTAGYPPNPVIVTKGRAICLPADSAELLAVRVDTGELLWSASRNDQFDLTAVDDSRALLSGPGAYLYDVTAGQQIWSGGDRVKDVCGRPAVTRGAILASGKGRLIRISLPGFSVTGPPLVRADGILGNLICVGGKLVAGNAAGVSAYFAYQDARAELTRRIEESSAAERPGLLYQRAMNAFNSGRPAEALVDLLEVRQSAQQSADGALLARTAQGLYRACVSLGDKASDGTERLTHYQKAQGFAYSDRSRAEMLVRLSKHFEQIGQFTHSAELAHRLTVEFANTDLVDVGIGAGADPFIRDDPDTPRMQGYDLGHRRIAELIARHGQACYAAFDTEAKTELDAAVAANDPEPVLAVAKTYRHSIWSPLALLRAAESYYQLALKPPEESRAERLRLSDRYLGRIIREYPRSRLAPSAWLGLAMVRRQRNPRIVWLALRGLEKLPGETKADFAGTSGSVRELLQQFSSLRRVTASNELPSHISPPVGPLFSGKEAAVILRGTDGRAVRVGETLFMLRGDRLCLFDTSAKTFQQAVKWETTVPIDMDRVSSYSFSAWAYSFAAGLTVDRSVLAIVSRGGSAGVDVRTGRLSWAHEYDPRAFGRMYAMAMGADEYVVLLNTGEILVHDKRTGRQLWRHRLGQSQLPWRAPPQLAGSMLLTCHGRTNLLATLFDMNTRKVAATGDVGPVGKGQAHLTADGLLVVFDGGSLRLSEPISGIGQPIWSVRLEPGTSPKILATTDTHVVVAPNSNQGLIQLRSLADDGSVVRTFQTSSVKGRAAYPLRGRIVGNRLYVVTGSRADYSFVAPTVRVLSYCRDPSLQVFDLSSGRPAWQAVDLSPAGGGTYVYAMPLEIGQRHICALSKAQPYTRPGTLRIIDFRTGRVVQEPVSVPGVPPGRKTSRYRYMLGSGPVLTSGRLVLDTPKGVVVYGKSN